MTIRRKHINILLIIINLILGVVAAGLYRRPQLSHRAELAPAEVHSRTDSTLQTDSPAPETTADSTQKPIAAPVNTEHPVRSLSFADVPPERVAKTGNPFRKEALKILNGHLAEPDSLSRRMILSYCEHLRAAYPSRDIDFIRQVFSDDALIIVGQVVRPVSGKESPAALSQKVKYITRSKQQYLQQLAKIFDSGKDISLEYSDFHILRHPTAEGIYGVTLRQKYSCGGYSDDGYLFLMWDFTNKSMPLIHVRTWQPAASVADPEDDLISFGDFNLE